MLRDRRRVSVRFETDAVVLANGDRREHLRGVQDTASQFIQLTWLFAHAARAAAGRQPRSTCRSRCRAASSLLDLRRRRASRRCTTPFGPLADVPPEAARASRRKPGEWLGRDVVRARAALPAGAHPHRAGAGSFVDLVIARKPEIAGLLSRGIIDDLFLTADRTMTYECILTDVRGGGARRIGLDHPEPAEAAERAQRHADGRARRRAARRSTPTTASAASSSPAARRRSPPAPTSARWRRTASSTPTEGRSSAATGRRSAGPQAGDRARSPASRSAAAASWR